MDFTDLFIDRLMITEWAANKELSEEAQGIVDDLHLDPLPKFEAKRWRLGGGLRGRFGPLIRKWGFYDAEVDAEVDAELERIAQEPVPTFIPVLPHRNGVDYEYFHNKVEAARAEVHPPLVVEARVSKAYVRREGAHFE